MISRHSFLYAPPMLGHSPFAPLNEAGLGQAAPQTVVIQAPAVATPPPQEQGVPLIGLLIVAGAVLVALEVGGVIDIFGLDKLQEKAKPAK